MSRRDSGYGRRVGMVIVKMICVGEGTGVSVGRWVTSSVAVGVQVLGSLKTVAVAVGICRVGGSVGGGKGFNDESGSERMDR